MDIVHRRERFARTVTEAGQTPPMYQASDKIFEDTVHNWCGRPATSGGRDIVRFAVHTPTISRMKLRIHLVAASLAAASIAPSLQAAVVDANPSNYQSVVSGLVAGDTLHLAPGKYTQGLSLAGKAGTPAQPIVVSGPDDQSAVFTSRACCSTVQLEDTSYVQVMNLTVDAGTRDGSAGVNSRGYSHHITLENLMIVGHGGGAQTAGISTSGTASDWTIRHNTIVSTARGLDFSNAEGNTPFVGGVIEYNVMVDTVDQPMEAAQRTVMRHNLAVSSADQKSSVESHAFAAAVMAAATPTVTLSASPSNVSAGSTAVLTWSSTDTAGCSASGGWTGTRGPSGTETVGPIQSTTSYQLTCLGAGGNAGATTQVTVGGTSTPPPTDPTPTPPPPSDPDPTPPPSDPNPTPPPPTDPTPPPSAPSPPPTEMNSSGGGGRIDMLALVVLALYAFARKALQVVRAD